ncbi:MAG: SDR family oxidoreductase [Alphaproteobacteria bacterium]|nr:SDR family oxidoreductase [Alphaproteobacteria bacterium]
MSYADPAASPTVAALLSLKGRTALVVGGAGLLGSEISFALAEQGATVIMAGRDAGRCHHRADEIMQKVPGARARGLNMDITKPDSIRAGVAEAARLAGGFHILVNCGWSGRKNTFESITDEDWDRDIEVSLNGVFRTIKAAVSVLATRNGVILNIASMYGVVAPDPGLYDSSKFANPPSYGAAKAGVVQLTKYLATFLAPQGIRVNCISPGPFPFETTQSENPEFIKRLAAKNPLGRIGRPHELKAVAALLCSDASSYMTGQNVSVDGGWTVW